MEKMKVEELRELMNVLSDCGDELVENYSHGYICDIISEIADSNVDIYYDDLFEWCKHNFDYVNDAIKEFGSSGDIIRDIRQGQYLQYTNELYEELDNIIYNYAINYIIEHYEEITDDQFEKIEDELYKIDNNNKFADIDEMIDGIMEENEEDEE